MKNFSLLFAMLLFSIATFAQTVTVDFSGVNPQSTNLQAELVGTNGGTTVTGAVAISGGAGTVDLNIATIGDYQLQIRNLDPLGQTITTLQVDLSGLATGDWDLDVNGTGNIPGFGVAVTSLSFNVPALPVELTKFSARADATSVVLIWETASEKNNEKFVVQHSIDGEDFSDIGEVSGSGTTLETSSYEFVDVFPITGVTNYYRLKQVDFDGAFEYSGIVSANSETKEPTNITVFGSGSSQPSFKFSASGSYQLTLMGSGQVVTTFTDVQPGQVIIPDFPVSGSYAINFIDESGNILAEKVAVTK